MKPDVVPVAWVYRKHNPWLYFVFRILRSVGPFAPVDYPLFYLHFWNTVIIYIGILC